MCLPVTWNGELSWKCEHSLCYPIKNQHCFPPFACFNFRMLLASNQVCLRCFSPLFFVLASVVCSCNKLRKHSHSQTSEITILWHSPPPHPIFFCSVCLRGSARQSPLKGWQRALSIRWTLEPFQRQRWGNFYEMGWSAYGLFRAHRYHLELNWTELNCSVHLFAFWPFFFSFFLRFWGKTKKSWQGKMGNEMKPIR